MKILAYLPGPIWCGFVWWADDLAGAWLSAVGMFGVCIYVLWEAGRKRAAREQPTPAMLQAGMEALANIGAERAHEDDALVCWYAMNDAASGRGK